MDYPETPELDKLRRINKSGDNETIGQFLEWAGENGYHLTKTVKYTDTRESLISGKPYEVEVEAEQPVGIEEVLYAFFGLDAAKISAEREAVYRSIKQD